MILTIALAAAAAAAPAPKATDTAQSAPASERRYCVVSTNTGTRIPQRDCRTRAEWLKDGYDPLVRN